jgi:hypothetical protein
MHARSALALVMVAPAIATAQPSLSSLWPNGDGMLWQYHMSLQRIVEDPTDWTGVATLYFYGTAETPGGTAQQLLGMHEGGPAPTSHFPGILGAVWQARPDLRPALESKYGARSATTAIWLPTLLHGGYFMKTAPSIQLWQVDSNHPTWTYLENNLVVGATFTLQLVPEIADDVFLYGSVEAVDATVQTLAGSFDHAVRIGYRVDYGWFQPPKTSDRVRAETTGHVHYVPDVGPVELHEEFVPYMEIDCGANPCPTEWTDRLGATDRTIEFSLESTITATAPRTFSQVKALYR